MVIHIVACPELNYWSSPSRRTAQNIYPCFALFRFAVVLPASRIFLSCVQSHWLWRTHLTKDTEYQHSGTAWCMTLPPHINAILLLLNLLSFTTFAISATNANTICSHTSPALPVLKKSRSIEPTTRQCRHQKRAPPPKAQLQNYFR